ncbi:hypothetical protein GCM10009864_60480 [Streptomyces lunalinharesii]|uniref:N-acetyltransferase domain-containing protein n=1 Tax=Streptomyces lunalinharesii TaxID=333384 RepID=A0ABN3SL16_9ACTN
MLRLLEAAWRAGQFDAAPTPERLDAVLAADRACAGVLRDADRITGFVSLGPLGLAGPPSTEAVFADIVAADAALQQPLTDWAAATTARLHGGRKIRTLRGGTFPAPPGFTEARRLLRMDCVLTGPHPQPIHPDLEVADYADLIHPDPTWVGAINDSLADQWGGYQSWTVRRWQARLPEVSGGIQLIASRRGGVAGVLLGNTGLRDDGGAQPVGFIEVVGTRPGYRRQGVAEYLVRCALARFQTQQIPRVVLFADGGSSTRASEIYGRCGFRHAFTYKVWERAVHG